jgi:hypothetical protein
MVGRWQDNGFFHVAGIHVCDDGFTRDVLLVIVNVRIDNLHGFLFLVL